MELRELAIEYKEIKAQIDELSRREKEVKAKLQEKAGTETIEAEGVKVSCYEVWEKKQTPAQYVKDQGIDLEVTYLDEPEYQYRITVAKK